MYDDDDDDEYWERVKRRNNPDNKPTGHYTGRCKKCGSSNLWDDNMSYGGAIYCG